MEGFSPFRRNFGEKKPKNYDCVIATGSDNTNRYFDYYFGHVPNLLRKNRTSVAVLDNEITHQDLKLLAGDIFNYFGLGCRSVTKVYVPKKDENTQKTSVAEIVGYTTSLVSILALIQNLN